tara:strand:- start:299 stop:484 length:186 start_codon:yes stop_codon:yes gene_type:complete
MPAWQIGYFTPNSLQIGLLSNNGILAPIYFYIYGEHSTPLTEQYYPFGLTVFLNNSLLEIS